MKTYLTKAERDYQNKLSFMSTSELLDEKESVSEMCKYVSASNPFHTKKFIISEEFMSRGLQCLAC